MWTRREEAIMTVQPLEIKRSSAAMWGTKTGMRDKPVVAKYIDTTTCIGCGYCSTGCPFDVPKFHKKTGKMAKCTLCVDRVEVGLEPACIKACPTGCLQFGTKDEMVALGNARVVQLKENGFKEAMLYDPPGVSGTGVVTILGHGHP